MHFTYEEYMKNAQHDQFDDFWNNTLIFIKNNVKQEETIVIPDEFMNFFEKSFPYSSLNFGKSSRFDWIVLHKGRLEIIKPKALVSTCDVFNIAFANEVFVVLNAREDFIDNCSDNVHAQSFLASL